MEVQNTTTQQPAHQLNRHLFSLNCSILLCEQGANSNYIILIGLFGGPIASLLDYHVPPVIRLWLFIIIPELIRFTCVGGIMMVYNGRSRRKK